MAKQMAKRSQGEGMVLGGSRESDIESDTSIEDYDECEEGSELDELLESSEYSDMKDNKE